MRELAFSKGESAEGLCRRCGLRGRHVSWSDCIRSLRDSLAELEIKADKKRKLHRPRR